MRASFGRWFTGTGTDGRTCSARSQPKGPSIPQPALAVDGPGAPPVSISEVRALGTVLGGHTRWENFQKNRGPRSFRRSSPRNSCRNLPLIGWTLTRGRYKPGRQLALTRSTGNCATALLPVAHVRRRVPEPPGRQRSVPRSGPAKRRPPRSRRPPGPRRVIPQSRCSWRWFLRSWSPPGPLAGLRWCPSSGQVFAPWRLHNSQVPALRALFTCRLFT